MNKKKLKDLLKDLSGETDTPAEVSLPKKDTALIESIGAMTEKMSSVLAHQEKVAMGVEERLQELSSSVSFFRQQTQKVIEDIALRERAVTSKDIAEAKTETAKMIATEISALRSLVERNANDTEALQENLQSVSDDLSEAIDGLDGKNASDISLSLDRVALVENEIKSVREENRETAKGTRSLSEFYRKLETDFKKKIKDIYEFGVSLQFLANGVSKGIAGVINFKNGTNTTVSVVPSAGNVGMDVSINVSTVGVSVLVPTGTIDNTNTAFVFTSKPKVVAVNGAFYRENNGWTWNAGTLTATIASPVGVGGDIYALT